MRRTAATSPFYSAWIDSGPADFTAARDAVARRDFTVLGSVAERNCMRMHATAMAADPPLLYWEPATIAVMRRVCELRSSGTEAYFSIDAGPQVKVLCETARADVVKAALAAVPGVLRVIASRPGGPARLVDAPPPWVQLADAPSVRRAVAS
jgi:diphosphomevalonate decarboxylase